jgi:hypothetical protein
MHDKAKKRKRVREVYWTCDKKRDCSATNHRTIEIGDVLNDDVCDYCHRRIHEPILIELNNDQQH